MNKIKKIIPAGGTEAKTHMGYNEKNPSQPEGAFTADSMENKNKPKKRIAKTKTQKNKT